MRFLSPARPTVRPLSAVAPTSSAPAHAPDQRRADRGAAPPTGAFSTVRVNAYALQAGDVLIGIPGMPRRTVAQVVARVAQDRVDCLIDTGLALVPQRIDTVNMLVTVTGGPTLLAAHLNPEHVEHSLAGFAPVYRPPVPELS